MATCVYVAQIPLHDVGELCANAATRYPRRNRLVPAHRCNSTMPVHHRDGPVPDHGEYNLALEEEEGKEEKEEGRRVWIWCQRCSTTWVYMVPTPSPLPHSTATTRCLLVAAKAQCTSTAVTAVYPLMEDTVWH